MIIIDALNVRSGGTELLLNYLIEIFEEKKVKYFVLYNEMLKETGEVTQEGNGKSFGNVKATKQRKKILKDYYVKMEPKTIICFGNYPLPFRAKKARVITSFQNLHLVKNYSKENFNALENLKYFAKRCYYRLNLKNSDYYVVPTPYIQKEFLNTYPISEKQVPIIPFYDEKLIDDYYDKIHQKATKEKGTFIYNSGPSEHKNHINLLRAWEILLNKGLKPKLKVTLRPGDHRSTPLLAYIKELKEKGANIINTHQTTYFYPYEDILTMTYEAEFTIYPSINETFGFGYIEGVKMGNNVLSTNKEFAKHVVDASAFFDPYDPEDIAKNVELALAGKLKDTELIFKNKINELLKLILEN